MMLVVGTTFVCRATSLTDPVVAENGVGLTGWWVQVEGVWGHVVPRVNALRLPIEAILGINFWSTESA